MNITTRGLRAVSLITMASAACGWVLLPASGASTADATSYTIVFKAKDSYSVDRKPAGDSNGDESFDSITLKQGAKVVGRASIHCVTVDPTYEGQLCNGVVFLDGGSLTFGGGAVNKAVPSADGRATPFAITGGTGRYAGAGGSIDVGRKLTITLS